jgi:hypothetical protein
VTDVSNELRAQCERLASASNRREAILIQMVETHIALMALNRRASGDRDLGERETELYRHRDRLITDLVAAEQEYQSSEEQARL